MTEVAGLRREEGSSHRRCVLPAQTRRQEVRRIEGNRIVCRRPKGCDIERLLSRLRGLGGREREGFEPVPLGKRELAVHVSSPEGLDEMLDENPDAVSVDPDSSSQIKSF